MAMVSALSSLADSPDFSEVKLIINFAKLYAAPPLVLCHLEPAGYHPLLCLSAQQERIEVRMNVC